MFGPYLLSSAAVWVAISTFPMCLVRFRVKYLTLVHLENDNEFPPNNTFVLYQYQTIRNTVPSDLLVCSPPKGNKLYLRQLVHSSYFCVSCQMLTR